MRGWTLPVRPGDVAHHLAMTEGTNMGFNEKANLTVIHHIGAGADRAGKMMDNGDHERGRHVQTQAKQQDAGGRADDGAGPGDRTDDAADAGETIADARDTMRETM
jgi:hypothetical protein